LNKYFCGEKAVDDWVGAGFSTQFLQEQGFEVTGVDVSKEMLDQAILNCQTTPFYLVQNGWIPLHVFIDLTGSQDAFSKNWLSLKVDSPKIKTSWLF
jgi:hypothetical protein